MAQYPEISANISAYQEAGDIEALGSLTLTQLATSFDRIEVGDLEDIFPTQISDERTIVVEQIIEGLGISPIVRPGVPNGSYSENRRVRRFSANPAFIRENDILDQYLINQLRKYGTTNERYAPTQIVADRVKQMMDRRKATIAMFRANALLGGVKYYDPRTDVSIDVDTQIPAHNLFKYNGFSAVVAANAPITGTPYKAFGPLTNSKNRTEALLFTDTQGNAGVPWTDKFADIARSIRLLKQFLWKTNKNKFTRIYMNSDMKTILHDNETIKAASGNLGLFGSSLPGGGNSVDATGSGQNNSANAYRFVDGDLDSISGCKIYEIDGLYRHPETNVLTNYWPSHKVVLLAPTHYKSSTEALGMTWHCMGESPEEKSGLWMRTIPDVGGVPSRTIQMGDAFLPVAKYPYWICVIDVCEPNYIADKLIISANMDYGTF